MFYPWRSDACVVHCMLVPDSEVAVDLMIKGLFRGFFAPFADIVEDIYNDIKVAVDIRVKGLLRWFVAPFVDIFEDLKVSVDIGVPLYGKGNQ